MKTFAVMIVCLAISLFVFGILLSIETKKDNKETQRLVSNVFPIDGNLVFPIKEGTKIDSIEEADKKADQYIEQWFNNGDHIADRETTLLLRNLVRDSFRKTVLR